MKKTWIILLLIVLIAGAVLLTTQIVKAAKASTDANTATNPANKLLGSTASTAFGANIKLYANGDSLRVRKSPSLTGDIITTVNAGTFIGTTTGTEKTADDLTWVEVTLSDATKAYVAKNYTYIIP
ncbi:SH3 domain-containing protein [Spirosoma aerolatum]|uniref:SH3 domain-containing protein n=1 Tax=Spirosoma aerolatum TaxID=1211326 RepID=UPI0009AF213A|nr:SH3 domain-containing protein [Spirosoma aerolatum]